MNQTLKQAYLKLAAAQRALADAQNRGDRREIDSLRKILIKRQQEYDAAVREFQEKETK